MNVPFCIAAIILAWRGLPARSGEQARNRTAGAARLDIAGLVLLCPALAALLYGLAQASTAAGFGQLRVIIPLAAGAVLLAAFGWHALHSAAVPLVDLRLFRHRGFTGAGTLMFLAGLSIYGAMLLLPLYFQQDRGFSALAAGLLLVPQGVGSILPRTIVGRLTDKLGPRPVSIAGILLAAIGTVPFALAGMHTSEWLLGVALVVRGAGLGAATIALMAGAFQGLSKPELPHASSATRIMQQVGGAFGAAVLVVILTSGAVHTAGPGGLSAAFDRTFWWSVGFTALALVPALLLPGRPATPATAAEPTRAEAKADVPSG